jgi:hypothetical protein
MKWGSWGKKLFSPGGGIDLTAVAAVPIHQPEGIAAA